jgi:aspartate dehydrogenase
MRVALLGCGAIGKVILEALLTDGIRGIRLVAVSECLPSGELEERLKGAAVPLTRDPLGLLDHSPDLVVEAAGQEAVETYGSSFLGAGKDLMVLSVGALADAPFRETLIGLAAAHGGRIIIPSGAIGGLDAVKSASLGKLREVTIVNIKPPQALEGAPYITKKGIDLGAIRKRTRIYEGFADEAAREFPKNMNVTVALGLAGIGPERTRVIIIVDPQETRNVHEITARGDFGEGTFSVAGLPSPDNPKTSYLAGLSALATLRNLVHPLRVGT